MKGDGGEKCVVNGIKHQHKHVALLAALDHMCW